MGSCNDPAVQRIYHFSDSDCKSGSIVTGHRPHHGLSLPPPPTPLSSPELTAGPLSPPLPPAAHHCSGGRSTVAVAAAVVTAVTVTAVTVTVVADDRVTTTARNVP